MGTLRLAWRALLQRYEPNTAPRVQRRMSLIISMASFPNDLPGYETKLAEWGELIMKWGSIRGDTFSTRMKRAIVVGRVLPRSRPSSRCGHAVG